MNVKNSIVLFAVALALLLGSVSAASSLDNALSLSNVTVLPNPIVAGQNVTVSVQLYNSYGSWLNTVSLQASGPYPISNVSPRGTRNIYQVNPGLSPGLYNFSFSIPSTTPAGVYKVYFNASYYALGATEVIGYSSMPVTFYVQNKPNIKVSLVSPSPSALYSGYNQSISVSIQNVGYGTARNVSVSLVPSYGVTLLSSVTSFFVANLTPGSIANKTILVSAQNVGNAGIQANIAYYSSTFKQRYASTQSLNLSIAPAAQFNISNFGFASLTPGAVSAPVNFKITNTGTSPAAAMQLTLQSTYPVTPITGTYYIPSLAPGSSTNATFLLSVDSQGKPGNYPVTIYEQWKQPNGAVNQQFTGSSNYFVAVTGGAGSLTLIGAVVAIIIVVVLVILIRRRSAGKKKK